MLTGRCSIPACTTAPKSRFYDGKEYCPKHYDDVIIHDFENEWMLWKSGDLSSKRLLYLLGRLAEEKWEIMEG
jgi:hypothetical protein